MFTGINKYLSFFLSTESPIYNSGPTVNVVTPNWHSSLHAWLCPHCSQASIDNGKTSRSVVASFYVTQQPSHVTRIPEFLVVVGTLRKFNFCAEIPSLTL